MDVTRYKIWKWLGPSKDGGKNPQFNVAVLTKAKRSDYNRYEIANELLCLRLGLALRLSIPAGFILDKDGQMYYASLHVAVAGEGLPPATDADLDAIASNERLACGIVMFDSWILNEDRHRGNISYMDESNQTFLVDHGCAFWDKDGRKFLLDSKDKLGIGDHCLAHRIKSLWSFDDWHRRMMEIPPSYVRDSVELASAVGLPTGEVDFCTDYLLDRRSRLRDIFKAHREATFPKLDEGLLDPLSGISVDYHI